MENCPTCRQIVPEDPAAANARASAMAKALGVPLDTYTPADLWAAAGALGTPPEDVTPEAITPEARAAVLDARGAALDARLAAMADLEAAKVVAAKAAADLSADASPVSLGAARAALADLATTRANAVALCVVDHALMDNKVRDDLRTVISAQNTAEK